uniref:G protein-coupled receptor n=1 Tax=Heterorhabditis bacteriophora TaxID=37862 RepID=A0A1I7WNU7_HETBA
MLIKNNFGTNTSICMDITHQHTWLRFQTMNDTNRILELEPTTSEIIEMFYQLSFFLIGTPINVYAFLRTRNIREGGVESRLVKLSRQLLIAHIMVLFTYGVWRSYWFYNIVWVQGELMHVFLISLYFA